jgi:hypothetical protein
VRKVPGFERGVGASLLAKSRRSRTCGRACLLPQNQRTTKDAQRNGRSRCNVLRTRVVVRLTRETELQRQQRTRRCRELKQGKHPAGARLAQNGKLRLF